MRQWNDELMQLMTSIKKTLSYSYMIVMRGARVERDEILPLINPWNEEMLEIFKLMVFQI